MHCDGKCYLRQQLSLSIDNADESDSAIATISEAFFPVFFYNPTYDFDFKKEAFLTQTIKASSVFWTAPNFSVLSPPPKI